MSNKVQLGEHFYRKIATKQVNKGSFIISC